MTNWTMTMTAWRMTHVSLFVRQYCADSLLFIAVIHMCTPVAPPGECPWNNERCCVPHRKARFFASPPFPSPHFCKPTPTTTPSPSYISWYFFHFHSLASFCPSSRDIQTTLHCNVPDSGSVYAQNGTLLWFAAETQSCQQIIVPDSGLYVVIIRCSVWVIHS